MGSSVKETLKSLCCANGWSYGVFWSFDQRNPMLLTMEDSYHEEQMGEIVANVLQEVHILGEGFVGQVASSRTHRWIFSDANGGGCIPSCSTRSQDDSEVHRQFRSGIKTIALISVESRGVIQLGSTQKILEQPEFLNLTKTLFKELKNVNGLSSAANQASPANCESDDLSEWFASFCSGNITPMHAGSCSELMELVYRPVDLTKVIVPKEKTTPLSLDSSHFTKQLQPASVEALRVLNSEPATQFQPSQSASSMDISAAKAPCISTWSNDSSIVTLLEPQWSSVRAVQDSPSVFYAKQSSPLYCGNIEQILGGDRFPSAFHDGVVNMSKTILENSERLMSNQHSAPSVCGTSDQVLVTETMPGFSEQIEMEGFAVDFSNSYLTDNQFGWLPAPEDNISALTSMMGEIFSPSVGVSQVSSSLAADVPLDIPLKQPANSAQSSITDAYVCGGVQSSIVLSSAEKDPFDGLGVESMCGQRGKCWEEMMPVKNEGCLDNITDVSKCMSDLDVGSAVGPRKALFSELGLAELLGGFSNFNCLRKFEDQASPCKRRRMETSSSVSSNHTHMASASCYGASMNPQPLHHSDNSHNLPPYPPEPKVNLWIDDSYNMNAGCAVLAKPKTIEEPKKAIKKRARPREGARPRPKDRQMILDRLAELKKIIPGGEKFTTDGLLDRTIKHMLFLQSVTKYADKLKQLDEPMLLGHQKETCPKENIRNGSGVTWALEVENQSMACPIIVEDLDQPGLMLIQMHCEDRGFFLEIADVIRDFGLNILRGVTEFQADEIWARFIVEARANITRREVIYFLVKLLERNAADRTELKNEPCNVVDGNIPFSNNYQQPAFHCPVSLTETLR